MGRGVRTAIAALVGVVGVLCGRAPAQVNLELRVVQSPISAGRIAEIGLYAVAEEPTAFIAVDVLLSWNEAFLVLEKEVLVSMQHSWGAVFGFPDDSMADGLNNSLSDGNALFQAASFPPAAMANSTGLLIGTLQFRALQDVSATDIGIAEAFGDFSATAVYQIGGLDVLGTTAGTTVEVYSEATISTVDVTIPPGVSVELPVSGDIDQIAALGVTLAVELVPGETSVGTVAFTGADDIVELGDPWPALGQFTTYDVDATGSALINGIVNDNGIFNPALVSFVGSIAAFPLIAEADALGTWQIRLCSGSCGQNGVPSRWDSTPDNVPTALMHGTLNVVAPGDGDGSRWVGLNDAAQFQACFTGNVGPLAEPAYPVFGAGACAVYDFDADGDVDHTDWSEFDAVYGGPP